ncbi:MAG: spore germination protein GerW family protein [Oscillospiraceae bacterium]
MEEKNPVSELLEETLKNLKGFVNADVVVGKEIVTADGTTIIPVSKVAMGYGVGGGSPEKLKFGGGSGGGITVSPMGFLIIKDGNIRLMQFSAADNTADRVISMVPEAINKVSDIIKNGRKKDEAQDDGKIKPKAEPENQ